MPYKSKKQAAYMHIHHPKIAAEWDAEGAKVEEECSTSMKELFSPTSQLPESEGKTCPSCEQGNHHRCRDAWCDCCGGSYQTPKMESVFRIEEAPIQNRPPPGSQMVKEPEYNTMGTVGQNLKKGLNALKSAGQEVTVYKTPQGGMIGYPKDAAPGRGPVQADMTKGGLWQPMTGSAAGTTSDPLSNSTTMK